MTLPTYVVVATETEQGRYLLHIPAINHHTEALDFDGIDHMARDLIAVMTQTLPDTFTLDVILEEAPL